MGGCFSSNNTADKDKTPAYLYCPRTLEERGPVPNTNANSIYTGEYVDPNLNSSNPNAFPTLTAPVHFDNDEAFTKDENLKDAECEDKVFNVLEDEPEPLLSTEEEDVCPTCFEEYDLENPRIITKCEHHFHMSCILEWMERSDTCPICDQQSDFGNFEFDDAEVIGSTGITMYSSASWTNQEDYDLCYIWCHFSVDTIRGNDQSGDTFWGKIAANFNKRHPEKKRSLSSLKGRFGKINRQTQCFESQIYKVKQQNPSGLGGEMSLRQKANELFLKNHLPENKHLPHYYQYMHCYEVLIRHPKWNSNNAKSIQSVQTKSKGKQKAQKTGFNSSPGDSGSGRDSNYVDITAGDDSMPSAGEDFRPPGVKKSKKKINVASYLEEKLSAASERMAKVTEDRNTCQVERMGIMKDFVSIERKREERQVIKMELEQKKEERELRKMELDRQMYEDSVMRMDLSALEDEDKEYWQDRKQEIRASRKNRR